MDRDLRRRMGGQRKHLHRLVNVMWNETRTVESVDRDEKDNLIESATSSLNT